MDPCLHLLSVLLVWIVDTGVNRPTFNPVRPGQTQSNTWSNVVNHVVKLGQRPRRCGL